MKNKLQILLLTIIIISFPSVSFSKVQTYIKEYTYQASEDDSRNSSRVTAMREVKRLLLEELGTYLESVTEVKNFQLTKDQITALTAGIVKTEVVSEKWDGHTYWIKTKIVADERDVIKSIDSLRKDREKSRELEEVKKRSDAILEENKNLREELKLAKGEDKENQKHNYDKSIKELSSIDWIESGIRNGRKGDYNTSLQDFNKAIELSPNDASAYGNRGVTYQMLGKYYEAIVDYNKAIELNPKYAEAYINRGDSYDNLGKYYEAIDDYNKAIELNPNIAEAYINRGAAYIKLGKYYEAIDDYNKTIELNPEYAEAYFNRGAAYQKLGKYYEAIDDYNKAIVIDPKYADAYSNRGISYYQLGKYNDAIDDFSRAIELNPKKANVYFIRSWIYSLIGNKKKAIEDLSKAIKINPDLRNDAKTNTAFDNIRNAPEFKRLIDK